MIIFVCGEVPIDSLFCMLHEQEQLATKNSSRYEQAEILKSFVITGFLHVKALYSGTPI